MSDLSTLEVAVETALSNDPNVTADVRQQAHDFCQNFQKSQDGWRLSCQQLLLRSKFPDDLVASATPETCGQLNDWLLGPRFWYARVITDRVASLPATERNDVRSFLLLYLREVLPWRASTLVQIATHGGSQACIPFSDNQAVLGKMALLYVRCLLTDYPQNWPTGVTELTDLWAHQRAEFRSNKTGDTNGSSKHEQIVRQKYLAMTQYFLSVMEAFDDEVVSDQMVRSIQEKNAGTIVKDALRDGDILTLADIWAKIFEDFGSSTDSVDLSISARCLKVLSKFVAWVDLQIIANDKFLGIAFNCCHAQNSCGPAAMELIGAIFYKRMDPGQRIVLSHKLGLLDQLLDRITLEDFGSSENKENSSALYMTNIDVVEPPLYAMKLAELLNLVGLQLLDAFVELRKGFSVWTSSVDEVEKDLRRLGGVQSVGPNPFFTPITSPEIWGELQREGWKMIQKLLPKVCLVFSHPYPDIALSVEPFISEWLKNVRHCVLNEEGQPNRSSPYNLGDPLCPLFVPIETIRPIFQSMFEMTLARIQYPFWFDFRASDENEAQETFLCFRRDITYLFKRLYSVDPPTSLLFIGQLCQRLASALTNSAAAVHVNQIEAVLHLVLTAGENYRDIGNEINQFNHPLAQSLRSLFSCQQLLHHSHPQIRIALFSLIHRFMPFIQNQSLHPPQADYISVVLEILVGPGGVLAGGIQRHSAPEVLSHATLTLSRFVKSNLPSIRPYAQQILLELAGGDLLNIRYFPSNQWPPAAPPTPSKLKQSLASSQTYEVPSGFPNESFTFDDQNRCFEICGLLIGSPGTVSDSAERVACLQKLLNPLFTPWEEVNVDGIQTTPSLQLAVTDPRGCVDWLTRHIQAIAHLTKGMTTCENFTFLWRKCLQIQTVTLQNFGHDSRIRSAVILLTRRLIALMRSSSEILASLAEIVPTLFDLTLGSFVECPNQSLDPEELRKNAVQDSSSEAEFTQAFSLLNISLQHLLQLRRTVVAGPIQATSTGHQELSQLCVLFNFIVSTYKGLQVEPFLLAKVPGFDSSSSQHLFTRIFHQCVDFWRIMAYGSAELLREKNEVHKDVFVMFHGLAANAPSTLLKLLEHEGGSGQGGNVLLEWMTSAVQPKFVHSLGAATSCLQTWQTFLVYLLTSADMVQLSNRIGIEAMLFDTLQLDRLIYGATQLAFLLDLENPSHTKVLQEISALLRVFSGSLPNSCDQTLVLPNHPQLVARLRRMFLQAMPSHVCSPQDATLVLQAVAEAQSCRDAKDVLRKWVITQQLSARSSEL